MKVNQIKAGVILSYVLLFLNSIVGISYTPFMLRMMGQSEYGLYSLTASIVGYLTILDLGFGNAIIRYTAKYRALNKKEDEYNLNGMFLIIYSLIAILAVILGIVLFFNVGNMFSKTMSSVEIHKAKIMMIFLIFNLAISFPFGIFGSIITAYENFVFAKTISIIRTIISPCIMIPLLLMGYKAIGMVVVATILNLICLLINTIYCFTKLKIKVKFNKFDFGLLKEIMLYSFFIFLNMIMDKINWSADQFILGAVSGTIMVAIYSVALQFNNYYLSFSTAISGVFLPRVTAMVTNNSSETVLSDMFIKIGRIQYVIMAFIISGFILLGQNFINTWAGNNYNSAYYMALIIMVPVTIPLLQNLGISILQAQNRQQFRSIVFIFIAILNICISIPLGKLYGGIGCAIGTAVALILGQIVVMNIYYYKKIHIDIPRFWKEIFRMTIPVLITFAIGIGMNYLWQGTGYLWFFIKAAAFSIAYIPLMWFMGMNNYEKDLFSQPIKKIKSKFNRGISI